MTEKLCGTVDAGIAPAGRNGKTQIVAGAYGAISNGTLSPAEYVRPACEFVPLRNST
jgi:hypothetical protein